MRNTLTFCMFVVVLFSASCNQDSVIEPEDCLKPYLTSDTLVDVMVGLNCPYSIFPNYPNRYLITELVFNPVNSDQLAIIRRDMGEPSDPQQFDELIVFNACTGSTTTIAGFAWQGGIDWSADGWIYFSGGTSPQSSGIWRTRPDGSNVEGVLDSGLGNVICSPSGQRIIYFGIYVASSGGIALDTLGNGNVTWCTWIDETSYIGVRETEIIRFDSSFSNVQSIDQIADGNFYSWPHAPAFDMINQRLYWITNNILAYNQFPSYQRVEFDNALSSRDYWSVDVSGDGETVGFTRLDRVVIDDCHQDVYLNAYIMNKDGGQVYRLDIPF